MTVAETEAPTRRKPRLRRRLLIGGVALVVAAVLVLAVCIAEIRLRASGHVYTAETVPSAPVALILGAQVNGNGTPSGYLAHRLDLGAALLAKGKVRALLLTGDFGQPQYDEPDAMKKYLIAHGVPARKIALDYAGFDTYSSCNRAYRIFGVREAVVVTQDFSVPRTVALCRSVGIAANGVGDSAEFHNTLYWKNWLRDQLASTKALWDIMTQPDPKFLGRQETSVQDAVNAP